MTQQSLCTVESLGDDGAREIMIPGSSPRFAIVLRRAGEVLAFENICPHASRPLNFAPDRFLFTPEGHLVCAAHGASFELPSGQCVGGPCAGYGLTRIEIEVRDGQVFVAPG
ncbi:MAG: Rieske (2Fe-2S) protein [Pseudomonadota bacterium]